MPGDLCTAPCIISLTPLSDVTLGASGLWLGTRREAGSSINTSGSSYSINDSTRSSYSRSDNTGNSSTDNSKLVIIVVRVQ